MTSVYRRIGLLAIPLILSNLTQPLLSTVDTVLSGHLPGAAALGGVAMGGIFFNAVFWTFGFLRMGTTGLVAQAHGARDEETLRIHFWRALLLAMMLGAAILLLQQPLIEVAMRLLGGSAEVQANARLYCGIRIWSAPAALAGYVLLGTLLGRQRARAALLLQAAINLVNVLLALWMVMRMGRGVAGIATATMLADWTGLLFGLVITLRLWRSLAVFPSLSRLAEGSGVRRLFALNRDIFLRTACLVGAFAWFTRTGAQLGDAALAANAVLLNLHMIASYALDGFANSTEALVGEAVGAGRKKDFRQVLHASTLVAGAVAMLISLLYLGLGTRLIALYTSHAEVQAAALRYLPWAVVLPMVSVLGYQMDGVFIGATRARELRNSMVLAVLGFLALEVTLGRWFGNGGLWAAFTGFMALRGLLLLLHLPRIERDFPISAI